MMNRKLSLTVAAASLLTCGCIPMERDLRVDQDLFNLKNRLNIVEQEISKQGKSRQGLSEQFNEQIDGISKRQANLQADQEGVRVELQTIRGLLDENTARRREDQDALLLAQKESTLRLSALDARLAKLEKELAELRALQTAKAAEPPAAAPAGEELYEQGRDLVLNKGDGSRARALLSEFIKTRPQSELLPNAYYWIGEAYYSEKNFEGAIVQFQDVIDKYPTHPKASAALYKQSLAFESLGEDKKADALMKRLIEAYPASDEAKKAKERISAKPKN